MFHRVQLLDDNGENDQDLLDRVGRAIAALEPFDLFFRYASADASLDDIEVHKWFSVDGELIKAVFDYGTPARYLSFDLKNAEAVERAIKLLGEPLPLLNLNAAVAAASGQSPQPGALMRVALASNRSPDAAALEVVRAGLASDEAERRMDAAKAAALMGRSELAPSLAQAIQKEPLTELRAVLEHALTQSR
jgi:hypothetical protein